MGTQFYFPRCSVSALSSRSSSGSIHQLLPTFTHTRPGHYPLPPPSPNPHARLSQPDLYTSLREPVPLSHLGSYTPPVLFGGYRQRVLPTSPRLGGVPKRLLRRAHQSDLAMRFQRHHELSVEGTPSREISENIVDPVYLALKQATGRYGGSSRRGSNFDSATPSPRNLSQVSLQDSGYSEAGMTKTNPMLGSTPQLDNAGRANSTATGRKRAPKLSTQMKSLSLDCQDMPPRINALNNALNATNRSPLSLGTKLIARDARNGKGLNGSSDLSDWDRSCSPVVQCRRSSSAAAPSTGYIVIHEYAPSNGAPPLLLGERVHVVDNGDPDWLHGFRVTDRTEHLMTFPATCVALMQPGEQAMRILQNVVVPEHKLRMYRDQVVFAQPDTLCEGKVTVRTEHNAFAPCPLTSLALL